MFAWWFAEPSVLGPFPLRSLTFVWEEVGVAVLELFGDLDSPPKVVEDDRGEAVPEDESFFFEDLFESLARDNCSCYNICQSNFR